MKTMLWVVFAVLSFSSCLKNDDSSHTESITNGSKWTLTIGSSPADVYSQLQALGRKRISAALLLYPVRHTANRKRYKIRLAIIMQ